MSAPYLIKQLTKVAVKNIPKLEAHVLKLEKHLQETMLEINQAKHFIELFKKSTGQDTQPTTNGIAANQSIQIARTVVRDPNVLNAMDEESIAIGRSLSMESFGIKDIESQLRLVNKTTSNVWNWISAWKNKSWIETLGAGRYKKKGCFGVR